MWRQLNLVNRLAKLLHTFEGAEIKHKLILFNCICRVVEYTIQLCIEFSYTIDKAIKTLFVQLEIYYNTLENLLLLSFIYSKATYNDL